MSLSNPGFIELLFIFGVALAFGFWELYTLRRDKKRSKKSQEPGRARDDVPGND